ncbi:unnamed protein product [Schistosoma margrebowiei]|uniref:Uncharacterized protein n=1 Tax=Schistosoma margrebowiei TaxID=48269 RepID=A0A183MBQ4_9TREM|nr:unnamed protein product [Schistosoma margrebowiei]
MWKTGKTSQIEAKMRRYNLAVLGISKAHWTQAGQQELNTGEMLLYSGHEEENAPHNQGVVQSSTKCICRMGISRIKNHQSIFQNKEGGDHNEYYSMLCTHR